MHMQMNINILLIIALALCLWRAYRGFRVGMAEEIYRLISLVVALFVLALSIMAISSFMDHNNKNGIVAVILIIITGIVFHLLSIVLNSLKTVAKLPIISFFNSILGIAAGVLEVAVAFWILYIIIQNFPTGAFGEQIMKWTNENEWLLRLYDSNYISGWISSFM